MTALDVELDEEAAWLASRKLGLGASDMANADTGAYGGGYAVVADKLGYDTDDNKNLGAKQRGHEWEQRIADAVHALTGLYVIGEQLQIISAANPVHRFTADGLLATTAEILGVDEADYVLEIKTKTQWVTGKRDYFYSQIQWQLHVTGFRRALLVIVSFTTDAATGVEIVEHIDFEWIDRDEYKIAQLVDLADRLWAHVEAGTLPDPDKFTPVEIVREVNRHGRLLLDADGNELIDPDVNIDDLAGDLERYHTKILPALASLKEERKTLEAKFRDRMAGHANAATRDGEWILRVGEPVAKLTSSGEAQALALHPEYGRTVLDRDRFKADHKALYEALKIPTSDRRLTVKFVKGPRVRARIAEQLAAPRTPDTIDAF